MVLPPSAQESGLTGYYHHLTRLLDEHSCDGPVAYFGQLAINSTTSDDPSVRELWTRIFLANLAMSAHEQAYSVLSSCPHLDLCVADPGKGLRSLDHQAERFPRPADLSHVRVE